jgi:hypothetical protein
LRAGRGFGGKINVNPNQKDSEQIDNRFATTRVFTHAGQRFFPSFTRADLPSLFAWKIKSVRARNNAYSAIVTAALILLLE